MLNAPTPTPYHAKLYVCLLNFFRKNYICCTKSAIVYPFVSTELVRLHPELGGLVCMMFFSAQDINLAYDEGSIFIF